VVGGNVYYDTPIIFNFNNQPIIWFKRDEDGYMTLNVRMLSTSSEPRMQMRDNFWLQRGSPEDLESPPSGKLLNVKYANGDSLRVRFFDLSSAEEAAKRYSDSQVDFLLENGVAFPLTAVEVHNDVAGTNIKFGPHSTEIGPVIMTGSCSIRYGAAIVMGPADNIPSSLEDRWSYDPEA